jgi:homoserine O-acetyltransferase/O-succinyltransferase
MADHELFEEPNFVLQKGAMLPVARLAYKTVGALNAARDNAVLVPSWYTGTHNDSETYMLGETRALDPRRYFIILTNLLGNGLSSSPSNTPAPFERGRFPHVTIYDNVRLQHLLLTKHLGIERLRLVVGWSMGACQTYQWAAQFPDMVRAACPIAGSERTAGFNQVFLLSLRRALELDPVFNEGFYDRPPVRGLQAFAAIYAGWGTSEPFFRTEAWRSALGAGMLMWPSSGSRFSCAAMPTIFSPSSGPGRQATLAETHFLRAISKQRSAPSKLERLSSRRNWIATSPRWTLNTKPSIFRTGNAAW